MKFHAVLRYVIIGAFTISLANCATSPVAEHPASARPVESRPTSLTPLQSDQATVPRRDEPRKPEEPDRVVPSSEEAVAALLDELVGNPGMWNQMCGFPTHKPPTQLPLGGYGRDWAPNFISAENFRRVRDVRDQVLEELGRRLPSLIPTLTGKAPTEVTVRDPNDRLEIYLMLMLDLNGVEALSQLLEVERALDHSTVYPDPEPAPSPRGERIILGGYSHHVQVLAVICAILANEGVPQIKQLGDTETIYDRAHRDLIVGIATDYLKTTPPEKFRGAAGMSANVKYR